MLCIDDVAFKVISFIVADDDFRYTRGSVVCNFKDNMPRCCRRFGQGGDFYCVAGNGESRGFFGAECGGVVLLDTGRERDLKCSVEMEGVAGREGIEVVYHDLAIGIGIETGFPISELADEFVAVAVCGFEVGNLGMRSLQPEESSFRWGDMKPYGAACALVCRGICCGGIMALYTLGRYFDGWFRCVSNGKEYRKQDFRE